MGPGFFTGSRIGVTTAKAFAYAVGARLIGVSSLEIIAHQVASARGGWKLCQAEGVRISAIVDAGRGELYWADFTGQFDSELENQVQIVSRQSWADSLADGVLVAGAPLEQLKDQLANGVVLAPQDCWIPTARTVGELARSKLKAGQIDDVIGLVPIYVRRSAAEEKRGPP